MLAPIKGILSKVVTIPSITFSCPRSKNVELKTKNDEIII
jgi:hypothetical protein